MCRAIAGMCIQEIKLSLDKQFNNSEIPLFIIIRLLNCKNLKVTLKFRGVFRLCCYFI